MVWDLDDTVWDGVVLEQDAAVPTPEALLALEVLDQRGILHAVASRGEYEPAAAHLRTHGIEEMFSAVEVGWGPKSVSVRRIAERLNLGLDAIAFVDNDPFERAEVSRALPQVRCYSAEKIATFPDLPELTPSLITEESRQRRALYRAERTRQEGEQEFVGSSSEFLASLELVMTVRRANEDDLARAHELTVRSNQLNTTGRTFDIDELRRLCASDEYEVLVASLADRFGGYGTIGLAVSELTDRDSVLQLLLMSCRVMSRGVGTALIQHVVDRAHAQGRRALAEFVPTEVNRVMLVTLRFSGFEVIDSNPARMVLMRSDVRRGALPNAGHVEVRSEDEMPSKDALP
ncbi:hypothetical protein BFN03_13375 [Rhodococcus sp. WMMA185]|uniref:HAD-IIIC family phosphatase n=1 Tax=Rhodococcus sp. WMMA185 TaxID=679318 RepID=UPI00087C3CDB|nr:hypothetical protein BFN03_13375 [Rhodococcus sp. WMMA185]